MDISMSCEGQVPKAIGTGNPTCVVFACEPAATVVEYEETKSTVVELEAPVFVRLSAILVVEIKDLR
jgi:hypothetical protein